MISFDRLHLKESFGSHTIVNGTFDHLYHEQDGQHLFSFCHYLKTFKPSAEATFVNVVIYNVYLSWFVSDHPRECNLLH